MWLMHVRIAFLLVKFIFCCVERFKMEQRTGIKYYVKLKKRATEIFEILKNKYSEEYLSSTCMLKWQKRF
jgi:hypothetical protein